MNFVQRLLGKSEPSHSVNEQQNYSHNGRVLTGKQVNSLLGLANPTMQAIILLSIQPTDQPATDPNSKYGVS